MRVFYGSRLSDNMTLTPEGYLICLNVPIARTGSQQYLRSELGLLDGDTNTDSPATCRIHQGSIQGIHVFSFPIIFFHVIKL